jgi:calcineurin-like phosphoesterase family protein
MGGRLMKTFITSDLHFHHRAISEFCPEVRGRWDSRNEPDKMNQDMIAMWNERVSPEDTVYILGDVAFGPSQGGIHCVSQLNGKLILIEGNHDRKNLRDPVFRRLFAEVHKYLEIDHSGHKIVMFHYPIFDHNQGWRGSIMCHGHRHGKPTGIPGRVFDVGFDATGEIVLLLDDLIEKALLVAPVPHH